MAFSDELSIEELKQKYAIADMPKELHEEFSEGKLLFKFLFEIMLGRVKQLLF